ncbi:MAG: malic enzyme-like NAD(P)-binding protein [Oscillospiraceae bacterium]|nr:malic enzyme-like NAD(P)-binding protein [Oscillospiraceae bacterium]
MAIKKEELRSLALKLHEDNRGKIETVSKCSVKTADDLSLAYTPGVAEPCREIAEDPELAYKYTFKGNMCAVITDGSAVLGLGNIGGLAGLPVMEGKAVLFKEFGGVDCFPICLATQDTDEIVNTCINIAPAFGGINLEDISAPRCFEIERRLKEALDIPVFHDDQHGTAIIVTAGLLNACKVTGKKAQDLVVVINGAGAAGTAIGKMILNLGVKDMFLLDSKGIIYTGRGEGMNWAKEEMAAVTNKAGRKGSLADALVGADVFIGVSQADILKPEMIKTMAKDPIVFALANPNPEIRPDAAKAAGVAVIATGRSDYPNQINNVLAFPGLFRGAFDVRASRITENMKLAASNALASIIPDSELTADYIIPAAFDARVRPAVAEAVARAAREDGVARL